MPQHTHKDVPQTWVQLTDANVTNVTFQNISDVEFYVTGTVGASTAPSEESFGILYGPGQGESDRPVSEIFPGVAGANRVWAKAVYGTARAFVSHA